MITDATTTWLRSSFCADGACVEVALMGDYVAIRDGKQTDGQPIVLTADDWAGFLRWLPESAQRE
jgi:uncharacterized protein DUF397